MNKRDAFFDACHQLGLESSKDLYAAYALGVCRRLLESMPEYSWITNAAKALRTLFEPGVGFDTVIGFSIKKESLTLAACETICTIAKDTSLYSFLRVYTPDLTGTPKSLYGILKTLSSAAKPMCDIVAVVQYMLVLRDGTRFEKDISLSSYNKYVDMFNSLSPVAKQMAGDTPMSYETYVNVSRARYNFLISTSPSAKEIINQLATFGMNSPPALAEVFGSATSFFNTHKKGIFSPYKYYGKVHALHPGLHAEDYEAIFNNIYSHIKEEEITASQFLEAAFRNAAVVSDERLEVHFCLPLFLKHNPQTLLAVNPSIPFLRQLIAKTDGRTTIYAAFSKEIYCDLLAADDSLKSSKVSFISYSSMSTQDAFPLFSAVCLFSIPPIPADTVKDVLSHMIPGASIYVLTASNTRNNYSQVFDESSAAIKVSSIHSFAPECSSTDPRRKILIEAHYLPPKPGERISVLFYEEDAKKAVCSKKAEISYEEWRSSETLAFIIAHQKQAPDENQRKASAEYRFSNEFSVWYSTFKDRNGTRYRFSLCQPLAKDVKHSRKGHGAIIPGTTKNKSFKSESEAEQFMAEQYLFDADIYSIASKMLQDQYPPQAFSQKKGTQKETTAVPHLSFKTFWYMFRSSFNRHREQIRDAMKELAYGEFDNMDIACISENDCVEAMKKFDCATEDHLEALWEALDLLLQFAVSQKYLQKNPIAKVFAARKHQEAEYAAVKSSLVRKSLTLDEAKQLVAFLLEQENNPYAAAVLLRQLTGMPAAEIAALRANDIIMHKNLSLYFFAVHATMKQGSSSPIPFDRREKYRRIPLVPLLEKILLPLRQDDASLPLLTDDGNQLSERKIREFSQVALRTIGIESDLIEVPQEDGNTRKADLGAYSMRSDFFRENFRIFAKEQCGFSVAECNYILGNVQQTTYASNYCDFANAFAQLKLQRKLCRAEALFRLPSITPHTVPTSKKALNFGAFSSAVHIDMDIITEDVPVDIAIQTNYGATFSVTAMEEGETNGR